MSSPALSGLASASAGGDRDVVRWSNRLRPALIHLLAIVLSAALLGIYARGGAAWPLGFLALIPWLLVLDRTRTLKGCVASGLLMSLAFALAVLPWFGMAIGSYTGIGPWLGVLVLGLMAPLLQAQLLAFVIVRHLVGKRHGPFLRALTAACAWVGCEWIFPKLLGDTLGHGLASATLIRQVADLGGAAGVTLLLLLVQEALLLAWTRRRQGLRVLLPALGVALGLPLLMAGYGMLRLSSLQEQLGQPQTFLRIGMIQANLVGYEARRQEIGAYAVVREVLDTHFQMSRGAREQHGVDVLLWPETVYPTTFGQPKSEDGAELDREILDFVEETQVALVFGSYDADPQGEYNAAAFVEPGAGLIGFYRKTHPFPLTEYVPAWLDGPRLRSLLPWVGNWRPGAGVRVMPLRSRDGRELNVVTLICLDDVRPGLALQGAALGAQAILGLSNDAWFSADPQGARLHLAVAAFRSIETRLPQLRVTTNGISAFVDPSGEVLAQTGLGDRAVLAGAVPVQDAPMTLMRHLGDWVGQLALGLLLLLAIGTALQGWIRSRVAGLEAAARPVEAEIPAILLTPAWRMLLTGLRLFALAGLLWLGLGMLLGEGLQVNSIRQIRVHLGCVLAPLLLGWLIQRAFHARLCIHGESLLVQGGHRSFEIPLARILALHAWRLPWPGPGVELELASGRRWLRALAMVDPERLRGLLVAGGARLGEAQKTSGLLAALAASRQRLRHRWLDHGGLRYGLFPLLLALPAFRLHQIIAFGGPFGEYYTYGLQAWLAGLLIWWASWSLGMMLFAALLRLLIEIPGSLVGLLRPGRLLAARCLLEWAGRVLYYLGLPLWLLLRILLA